jgi:hypothetical protein
MAGPDQRAPLSLDDPPEAFVLGAAVDPRGARIAWSRNLGDLPVEPAVTAVLEDHRAALEAMGCVVEDVEPDLTAADDAFEVLRGVAFAQAFGPVLETDGDQLKETIRWNTRVGLALTGADVARAIGLQTEMYERMRALLERYDALALPVSQVAPFAVEQEWVTEIAGTAMGSYLEWMRSCSRITVTAHPALAARRLTPRPARRRTARRRRAASSPSCAWPRPSSRPPGSGAARRSVSPGMRRSRPTRHLRLAAPERGTARRTWPHRYSPAGSRPRPIRSASPAARWRPARASTGPSTRRSRSPSPKR